MVMVFGMMWYLKGKLLVGLFGGTFTLARHGGKQDRGSLQVPFLVVFSAGHFGIPNSPQPACLPPTYNLYALTYARLVQAAWP